MAKFRLYFKIRKNPTFDLVLGQGLLWAHEVKMCFNPNAKIVIDGMSIPLIDEDFNKASSSKNNLSKSTESKPGLAQEEVMNIINKILSGAQDIKHQKSHHGIFHNMPPVPPMPRRLDDDVSKNHGVSKKNRVNYSMDSDISDSSDSSLSRL